MNKLIPARKLAVGQKFKFSGKTGEACFIRNGVCTVVSLRDGGKRGVMCTFGESSETYPVTAAKMVYPA